ncbi:MAG: OmpA family protein [Hyphomonas sp.]
MMKTVLFAAVGLGLAAAAGMPAVSDTPPPPPTEPVYIARKPSCDDLKLSIYFPAHESMLSSFSVRALNAASDNLSGCAVTRIDVAVVSEEAGTDAELSDLSEARAASVLEALASNGISAPRIRTSYEPATQAADDDTAPVEPMARRVDLKLKVKPVYGL